MDIEAFWVTSEPPDVPTTSLSGGSPGEEMGRRQLRVAFLVQQGATCEELPAVEIRAVKVSLASSSKAIICRHQQASWTVDPSIVQPDVMG